jgi:hypothetical protein
MPRLTEHLEEDAALATQSGPGRVTRRGNYSWAVRGISGPNPSFRGDDGSPDPGVTQTLRAFAAAEGTEHAVLTALAASRLLVPVVAVPSEQPGQGDRAEPDEHACQAGNAAEKETEMALPTLIGLDGRRAIPAFTCLDSMRRWQPDARPVPAAARQVWEAATADSCAVIIDVAGPVPFAVEGSRLAALARGEAAPAPCADCDVHEVVSDVLAGQLDVAGFELRPGGPDNDLVIALTLAADPAGRDVTELASSVAESVLERLGGRLRRGIAIWLGRAGAPA